MTCHPRARDARSEHFGGTDEAQPDHHHEQEAHERGHLVQVRRNEPDQAEPDEAGPEGEDDVGEGEAPARDVAVADRRRGDRVDEALWTQWAVRPPASAVRGRGDDGRERDPPAAAAGAGFIRRGKCD